MSHTARQEIAESDARRSRTGNGLGYQALAMYHPESQTAVAIVLNATGPDSDLPAHILEQVQDLILAG